MAQVWTTTDLRSEHLLLSSKSPTLGVRSALNTWDKHSKRLICPHPDARFCLLLTLRIANLIQHAGSYYSILRKATDFTAALQCATDFRGGSDTGSQAMVVLRKMLWVSRPVSVFHDNSISLFLRVQEALPFSLVWPSQCPHPIPSETASLWHPSIPQGLL